MIKFNEVTWYSKLAAVIVFLVIVPILAFYIGTQYQEIKDSNSIVAPAQNHTPAVSEKNNGPKDVTSVAKSVLVALKNKDYSTLENFTSSQGLSWNEYPSLDMSKSDIIKTEISNIPTNSQKYLFGYTDGKGDPINLTISEYLDKWIYNKDYLNADEIAVNKMLDGGTNSLNTIIKDAGNRTVVAFYFKGFDRKYEGMDWTTLYLVFDLENGEYKLRGIAKNNWTI
jgi:hypothetical protein